MAEDAARRAAFVRGLAELARTTGYTVQGCDGCGCCASRQCPAVRDLGSQRLIDITLSGDELTITPSPHNP